MVIQAKNRVAITGMGAICGLGHDLKSTWANLIEGRPGISVINQSPIQSEKIPLRIAGEVKDFSISHDIIEPKEIDRFDKFILFALHSAHEALKDANLLENSPYPAEKMGSIIGCGMGGMPFMEANYENFLQKGYKRVSPFFIPGIIPNMAPGLLSLKFNLKGVNYSISSACASAGHSIGAAAMEIAMGNHDVIVSGGAESVISYLPIAGFTNMKALSKNEDPLSASRPFDMGRDGFVMGEGAGILVLENLDKAVARGAKIYAELVGSGSSNDCYHITAPHPEGEGASRCIEQSLSNAGISPQDIGYINAHRTSTPLGDLTESKALKRVFKESLKDIYVSSTKSMTGHLLGAAGGIESIFCAMALYEGILPPTINLMNPDPEIDLKHVANVSIKKQAEYALNNSFGFGGTNSSLIFKRYQS